MIGSPRPWWRPRLDGLAPRVAAFLTLALLPLGLIALWQTREFQHESLRRSELTLLALTEQGAAGVQSAVERAVGAAESLAVVTDLLDDPETCSVYLGRFLEGGNPFDFVGLVPAEGPVTCSSVGVPFAVDAEARAELDDLMAEPRLAIRPSGSREALVVGMPIATEIGVGGFPGYLALSIPLDGIEAAPAIPSALRPLQLVTFNERGDVLTSQGDGTEATAIASLLPEGRDLAGLRSETARLFGGRSAGGTEQIYTVAPLVPGLAYVLAVWTPEQAGIGIGGLRDSPLLFPLLMWSVSLVVAFWSIHRLVIRCVTDLAQQMRRFGRDRSLPERVTDEAMPHELREIENAFRTMANAILHDEARMENAFRERGVLLREVHHRVKNNLQLISSIISMQVRRMPEARTRAILRRLQDRVLTLASIYRTLYTSPDLGDVNAAPVVRAIVEQELRNAPDRVEATLDIEDMVLDPDKVVPIAFLAAEAVSNALARAGTAEGRPSLSVTLHRDGETATLRIVNSLAGPTPAEASSRNGLGQHLIQAFAAQVGGPVAIDADDRLYALSVVFPVETHHAETEDA